MKYLDGEEDNDEMSNIIIADLDAMQDGSNFGYNDFVIQMTREGPPRLWAIPKGAFGEKLMEELKDLYGVNNR